MTKYGHLEQRGISFADAVSLELQITNILHANPDYHLTEIMNLVSDIVEKHENRIYELEGEVSALEVMGYDVDSLESANEELVEDINHLKLEIRELARENDILTRRLEND